MPAAQKTIFSVQSREVTGKKVKSLRHQHLLPANVSGLNVPSESVQVNTKLFNKLYAEEGDTGLIYLQIGGNKKLVPVLIQDVQVDSMSGQTVHAAFRRVDLTEKITAEVPVEVVGEIDIENATLITVHDSIEVEALPEDLPDAFEIDVSVLTEVGQAIYVSALQYDKEKVSLVLGDEVDPETEPVVLVQEVKEEVIEEPVVEAAEGETAEGEGAAEGEQTPAAEEGGAEQGGE